MTAVKVKNQSLNALKGIATILIIFIHAPLNGLFGQFIIAVARTGVALFFVISGYYLMPRNNPQKKILRIVKITCISYFFYLMWGIFCRIIGSGFDSSLIWVRSIFQPYSIVRFFILQEDIVAGHLWFLNALIFCYLLSLLLLKWLDKYLGLVVSISLLCIHLIITNILSPAYSLRIVSACFRNGLFYGFPFFVLGIHIYRWNKDGKIKISNQKLMVVSIVSTLLIGIERIAFGYHQLYVGNVILLLCVFLLCIKNPHLSGGRRLQSIGEKYSMYIYIEQWAVISFVDKIFRIFEIPKTNLFSLLAAVFTIIFSIITQKFITKFLLKSE